jgi:hypothetical protein
MISVHVINLHALFDRFACRYAAQCRAKISSLWSLPKHNVVGIMNGLPLGDSLAAEMASGKMDFQVR